MNSLDQTSVIVGMSGGVDSSVAALLLKTQGYRVSGLFMKNWDEDDDTEYCTAKADLEDAQRVCDKLDIELHTANFAAEYWDNVFEKFLQEYAAGRTPNPDVLCNREIKFKQFADYASLLGADLIATGHYVRRDPTLPGANEVFRLRKAVDLNKDQSYFLQAVPADKLQSCLFPLGELHKPEVRQIADDVGFHNYRKKDSTGICFIGERRFAEFLQRYLDKSPGAIRDTEGRTLGQHIGLPYYTLGQRQGLGIGGVAGYPEAPWYVVEKRQSPNELIVTQHVSDLDGYWLAASQFNWLIEPPAFPFDCNAKVRYRQPDQACTVSQRADGALRVAFDTPQRAITPGQYVCLYRGDICLGGGVIEIAQRNLFFQPTPLKTTRSPAMPASHQYTRTNADS